MSWLCYDPLLPTWDALKLRLDLWGRFDTFPSLLLLFQSYAKGSWSWHSSWWLRPLLCADPCCALTLSLGQSTHLLRLVGAVASCNGMSLWESLSPMAKTGFLDVSSIRCLVHLSVACLSKLLSNQLLPASKQMIPTNWESDNACTIACFWVQGRYGGENSSWERWKWEESNALQWDTELISEGQNKREESHPVRSVWGHSRGCGISLVILRHDHLPPSRAVWGWGLRACWGRCSQDVSMTHWLPGSVIGMALKEWSPVILPLNHRVSLKVQVKCPRGWNDGWCNENWCDSGPGRCPAVITDGDALAAATSCWVIKRAPWRDVVTVTVEEEVEDAWKEPGCPWPGGALAGQQAAGWSERLVLVSPGLLKEGKC